MKTTRRIVQLGFLAFVLLGVFVWRGNAELWCPMGGVEAIYTYWTEGNMLCSLGVSNFYILGGVLVMTLLLRRAFCGYMCPIGAISELLRTLGERFGLKGLHVPPSADRLLALLKYAVLGVVLWLTWRAGELVFRGFDPCYALISRHGEDITVWAYAALAGVAAASLLTTVPFCRWLCPLAAVLNPFSRVGLMRVRRSESACIGCGCCAAECPMAIPVDQLLQVTAARCIACMNCIDACPKPGALQWAAATERRPTADRPAPSMRPRQIGLIAVLLLCTTGAVAAAHLFPVASFVRISDAALPATVASVTLKISDLTCRGRANLLVWFLERDDLYRIPGKSSDEPGYFRLEAWPDPTLAEVRIDYDATRCDRETIVRAITEPYFDAATDRWWTSPFAVEGHDPLAPSP